MPCGAVAGQGAFPDWTDEVVYTLLILFQTSLDRHLPLHRNEEPRTHPRAQKGASRLKADSSSHRRAVRARRGWLPIALDADTLVSEAIRCADDAEEAIALVAGERSVLVTSTRSLRLSARSRIASPAATSSATRSALNHRRCSGSPSTTMPCAGSAISKFYSPGSTRSTSSSSTIWSTEVMRSARVAGRAQAT